MIASRQHGFIFIKTIKTANTSIELALSPFCGPHDVLLPISARHDLARAAGGPRPWNFADPETERRYLRALRKENPKLLKGVLREIEASSFWAHAFPDAIKAKVGDLWESAFKFTSERHPCEKALSLAYFTSRGCRDFLAHLHRTVFEDTRYVGYRRYIVDGRVIVGDFVMY